MTISIREATAFDAQNLHRMICELAAYEKEEHSVKVTELELENQLRLQSPPFGCLIAESDGVICGFALYFYGYSTWEGSRTLYLEDLYVNPEYRGEGAGLALMRSLAQLADEQKCKRFEWSVLNWNEPAIKFYKQIGAEPMRDWTRYRMDSNAMTQLMGANTTKPKKTA
ncbi:MAG TPA: GNAT family N-acetyltransferase [Drouetiella sp.]|jgi:GNAT superfamily N-acetyltransferase